MACRLCQLPITSSLCDVCRELSEERTSRRSAVCEECGAPVNSGVEVGELCRVCMAMFETVRENRWLFRAHVEWEQENILLARRKRELLGMGGAAATQG